MLARKIVTARGLRQMVKATRQDELGVPPITRALELTNYGQWGKFRMSYDRICPKVVKPNEILVRNLASSLNRHDYEMRDGYLIAFIDSCRLHSDEPNEGHELPLVLGRDFAGVVMDVGPDVKLFQPGDEVFGSRSNLKQGCLSDFIVVDETEARRKPQSLSFIDAASMPYVAGAVFTAFHQPFFKRQFYKNLRGKRVLLHGAGGGVGTMALQLLKAGGAHVTTTSLTRSFPLLQGLGADDMLAFRAKEFVVDLESREKYDVIVDVPGHCDGFLMRCAKYGGAYVSFRQRLYEKYTEEDVDLLCGITKDVLLTKMRFRWKYGSTYYYYSQADPFRFYLDYLAEQIEEDTIVPVVQKVIGLEDVPETMKLIDKEDVQGKVVVDLLRTALDKQTVEEGDHCRPHKEEPVLADRASAR